ncbi:uncharacterized protein LOC116850682 isoform X2 [Odontomachus brunneus]|uniref:uncharacterized protein LOC116850682 isoform X2 n=1 Tax=Odontomachus brunneus TaxID=486640 RepID=UPI0013F22060|nr:uncharacterized protein LOC116850682 isoform X2 [Odontomachus brunneus]
MSSGVPKMSFARKMSSGVPKINLTRFYQQDVVKWIFYCGTDEKYRARCVLRASDLPNDKWDMEKAAVMGLTICSTQEYIISVAANGLIHDRAWRNVGTITIASTASMASGEILAFTGVSSILAVLSRNQMVGAYCGFRHDEDQELEEEVRVAPARIAEEARYLKPGAHRKRRKQ